MKNLFRGIPFSQEDEIHEHIQMSIFLGRRAKGNLACCFHSSLQVVEWDFQRKSSIWLVRNGRLKPGKLLSLIGNIGIKQDSFQYRCFDIQGEKFPQMPDLF